MWFNSDLKWFIQKIDGSALVLVVVRHRRFSGELEKS
jgi:hypothetical protein